ncbi:four-carbon acid sugar kinase family protein [Microbacterium sp. QXD-8]|uniref:Four-carbon acid sugar kinase family protein n=1 Tax=Microbacterium psychrotolerans TaxID=3068321 RepID=A0ABU0Z3M1_9MICO|nr:four-carbon acid sugar kinase family protein [Microbacterium sp. QXD-8]MDQ7879186.1 four-carbon acid sugar kinase family protein [Microbacterium sp. QXD-8]
MSRARVAFYGDDFTGSVDALLQFARRGWTGRLFTGLPDAETLRRAADEVDVVGVAGISRSLAPTEMDDELRPVFAAFADLEPQLVQYKACSTADSAPHVGSLGRVVELAREVFGDRAVPMLFAQPDFGRYTLFGQHFAAERGIVYRLDRQPTMSQHPSTPMTEADLAVHVGRQTELPIGAVPLVEFDALAARLQAAPEAGLVLDTLTDEHLVTIGEALVALPAPVFAIGSGGLSHGVAAAAPGEAPAVPTSTAAHGPVLVVSGSRSAQTRRQADAAADAGWLVRPLPLGGPVPAAVISEVVGSLRSDRGVVLTSDDADTATSDERPVLEAIAEAAASVISTIARDGASRRVIVCGGDTSSRVTRLLAVESLSIAANPWGNVVLLRADAEDPAIDGLELLLKGGQVGADSLFIDVAALGS